MNKTYSVAVLVGSLRKASINRKLALALDAAAGSLPRRGRQLLR